jgi:hypothetical protein
VRIDPYLLRTSAVACSSFIASENMEYESNECDGGVEYDQAQSRQRPALCRYLCSRTSTQEQSCHYLR